MTKKPLALLIGLLVAHGACAQLTVTFTTTQPGGQYKPKNVAAAWIETSSGAFVKTIARYGDTRANDMALWKAASGGKSVDADAYMGATRANHNAPVAITAVWDFKNRAGTPMADGNYKIRFNCDDGGEKDYSIAFVKGPTALQWTDPGTTYFKNIVISYALPDSDNDRMPDSWELDHGMIVGIDDSALDADGDGLSNYGEYVAGTDPQRSNSVFALEAPRPNGPTDLSLVWSSVAGKNYAIEYNTNLATTNGWSTLSNAISATPPANTSTVPVSVDTRYYRISVQ